MWRLPLLMWKCCKDAESVQNPLKQERFSIRSAAAHVCGRLGGSDLQHQPSNAVWWKPQKKNLLQSFSTWCVGSVWLLAGSSWTNLLTRCRTLCLSSFVCLLQYLLSTPLKHGVRWPVRDDKIGEELDFNLRWSWRLLYLAAVTSTQCCQEIRGSLRPRQWNWHHRHVQEHRCVFFSHSLHTSALAA